MNQFQKQHGQQVQEHEQERLPTSFICPLTMKIMDDPVMDQCAHNFERQAIVEWLSSSSTGTASTSTVSTTSCCPISNKPLSICDLIPNHTLAERIERWKWLREDSTIDYNYDESIDEHHDIEEGEVQQEQQQSRRRQWFPHRKRQIHRSRRAVSKPNTTKQQSKQQQQLEYTSIPTGVTTTNAMITTPQTATNSSSSSIHHPTTRTTTIDLMLLPQERLALQKLQNENQMKQNEYNQKRMIRTLLIAMILCIILTVISCIVLYIRTIQQQQNNINNDDEEVGVDVGEEVYDMNMTDDKN